MDALLTEGDFAINRGVIVLEVNRVDVALDIIKHNAHNVEHATERGGISSVSFNAENRENFTHMVTLCTPAT